PPSRWRPPGQDPPRHRSGEPLDRLLWHPRSALHRHAIEPMVHWAMTGPPTTRGLLDNRAQTRLIDWQLGVARWTLRQRPHGRYARELPAAAFRGAGRRLGGTGHGRRGGGGWWLGWVRAGGAAE